MKKGLLIAVILLLSIAYLLPFFEANSIQDEINKITYYAKEYETGNINYAQLLIYTGTSRESLNELLGVVDKREGGLLKQDQIQEALGNPTEETKWVWIEKENHDKKLDSPVPAWRKMVFDGNEIQIRLNAWPSIIKKEFAEELNLDSEGDENLIVYRLNVEINFKEPDEDLEIESKISDIKSLAEEFNSDPSQSNAESLAQESVNVEKLFNDYYRQNPLECKEVMKSIFGSENKREEQNLLVYEFELIESDEFDSSARLEMCDDCQWYYINFDFWIDSRGKFKIDEDRKDDSSGYENLYQDYDDEKFKSEIKNKVDELKDSINNNEFNRVNSLRNEIRILNEKWNQYSNEVWDEVNKEYDSKYKSMTDEERYKFDQSYGWIRDEQEKRQKVKSIQKENYEERKQFFIDLFSEYEKKEYYYNQEQYEKRLIEEFKEFGEETCNNNKDDNNNGEIDCQESQCGGKICAFESYEITEENSTTMQNRDLYCIQKICQAKEEIVEQNVSVCGDHVCEVDETIESCSQDCSLCQTFEAIECSGKVIFSGENKDGCPLAPICLEENSIQICTSSEDCTQQLCGISECVKEEDSQDGECKVTQLKECEESKCNDGNEKVENCQSGDKLVIEVCINGLWKKTGMDCEDAESEIIDEDEIPESNESSQSSSNLQSGEPQIIEEELGNSCVVRSECGNENDVCSNGNCVTLPQTADEDQDEIEESDTPVVDDEEVEVDVPQEDFSDDSEESQNENIREDDGSVEESENEPQESPSQEESQQEQTTTETIFSLLRVFSGRITGAFISMTGNQVEETNTGGGTDSGSQNSDSQTDSQSTSDTSDLVNENNEQNTEPVTDENINQPPPQTDNYEDEDDEEDDERERRQEEQENRCNEDCSRTCYDTKVRPCVQECIREACGEEMNCNIDEEQPKCEQTCSSDLNSCQEECIPKCKEGGEWWKEYQPDNEHQENKIEKGVFTVGGSCRKSQSKEEAFIWFGGWGEPFQEIQPLKNKYYNQGNEDWCKREYDNLLKRRQEFEKSFDQEFVTWYFDKYLSNSAQDWEKQSSAIYELYWSNVDTIRQIAERMDCLDIQEFPSQNLISVKYETEYGMLEYWEEIETVKLDRMESEVSVITPYMKIWIFPSKEFMKYELKEFSKKHKLPGPEDMQNQGYTEDEKNELKQDEKYMDNIIKISEKYDGNFNAVFQINDYESGEVLFNSYITINEDDLFLIEPMPYEDVPTEEGKVEISFDKVYDLVYSSEKDMNGARTESPEWAKKDTSFNEGIKQSIDGVKIYFKMMAVKNSARFYPEDSQKELSFVLSEFFNLMGDGEEGDKMKEFDDEEKEKFNDEFNDEQEQEFDEDIFQKKEILTGEIIKN